MDLGISLCASAALVRSTCARPRDVVSGGVNAPRVQQNEDRVADCRKLLHIRTVRFFDHHVIASSSRFSSVDGLRTCCI